MTSMEITLDQLLVAAKNRHAPVTAETAGYIALALADAMATSPALLREVNVRLQEGGDVVLIGALRATDEATAERCVRVLLGHLLQVAAGSSPALATCTKRHVGAGTTALVHELESALVPVNRAAAKRAIARLVREVGRAVASDGSPARRRQAHAAPAAQPAPPERVVAPRPPRPASAPAARAPSPAPATVSPLPATVSPLPATVSAAAAAPYEDLAPLDAVLEAATEPECTEPLAVPPTPTEELVSVAEPTAPAPVVEPVPHAPPAPYPPVQDPTPAPPTSANLTPSLATYDPAPEASSAHAAVARDGASSPGPEVPPSGAQSDVQEEDGEGAARCAEPEEEDAEELQTYDPPTAEDDERFDFGTAAPPAVEPRPPRGQPPAPPAIEASASAEPVHAAAAHETPSPLEQQASAVPPQAGAPQEASAAPPIADEAAPDGPAAGTADQASQADRVNELLAEFGQSRQRSSREVAGDLKEMLGLAPTPPPPLAVPGPDGAETQTSSADSARSDAGRAFSSVEFGRPRQPRLAFALVVTVLILAVLGLGAVYVAFPQLLLHP